MDTCSYFIQNKALFGSMPNNDTVKELEKIGVKYFVDLTSSKEKLTTPYQTELQILQYPIPDRKIPKDYLSFAQFVYDVYLKIKNLNDNEKLYIHCKGGHGRSGIVVACILCLYLKIPPEIALDLTKFYHQQRKTMRDKWRRIGSPQTFTQKDFVKKLFEPFYFNTHQNSFLSNSSSYVVNDKGLGKFYCVEAAYQAYKNPEDKQYVNSLRQCTSIKDIKKLGKSTMLRTDWENVKDSIMYKLIKEKFDTHPDIKEKLLQTLLRPIVCKTNDTSYWKDKNHNRLGKLLQKIRNDYFALS